MVCSRSLRARARRPLSAAGVGGAGAPQKLFSVEHGVVPRAPTDALQLWRVRGCVRRAYFATEIYESLLFDYCRK